MDSIVETFSELEVTWPVRMKKQSKFKDIRCFDASEVINADARMESTSFIEISRDELQSLDGDWLHLKFTGSAVVKPLNPHYVREVTCFAESEIEWFWSRGSDGNTVEGFAILEYDQYAKYLDWRFGMEIEVNLIVDLSATPS